MCPGIRVAIFTSISARLSATDDLVHTVPISDQSGESWAFRSYVDRADEFRRYGAKLFAGVLIVAISALAYRVFAPHEPTLALAGTFMLLSSAVFACIAAMLGLILGAGFHRTDRNSRRLPENRGLDGFLQCPGSHSCPVRKGVAHPCRPGCAGIWRAGCLDRRPAQVAWLAGHSLWDSAALDLAGKYRFDADGPRETRTGLDTD